MQQSSQQPQQQEDDLNPIFYELKDSLVWLKIIAICTLISGIIIALSIIGIIIAWFPIWLGIVLLQATSRLELAERHRDIPALVEGLHKIKTYLIIKGSGALCLLILLGFILALALNIAFPF